MHDEPAIYWTLRDGTRVARDYVRQRTVRYIKRRFGVTGAARAEALRRTIDDDKWARTHRGELVEAACRDVGTLAVLLNYTEPAQWADISTS